MNKHEHALFALLEARYPPEKGWALLPQVANGTGHSRRTRTADALLMQLWPSRGLELHGFEFKASRRDWLTELKTPEKAEDIAAYCHKWTVLAPEGVVKMDELPPAWGLMQVVDGKRIKISRPAPAQEYVKPIDLLFLAAILRRVQRTVTEAPGGVALKAEYNRGFEKGRSVEAAQTEHRLAREREEHERLKVELEAFEEASGIRITRWGGAGEVGQIVKLLRSGGLKREVLELQRVARTAERVASNIHDGLAQLDEEVAP